MDTFTRVTAHSDGESLRAAPLDRLVELLQDQATRKLDVAITAATAHSTDGALILEGTEKQLSLDGVTDTAGRYELNAVALSGIADKLKIPLPYLRRMREEHVELFDTNVNAWLERAAKPFMVRCLRGGDGGGIARAFLSDRYARIDNLDVLLAALDGVRQAGVGIQIDGCDLTDQRMHVRIVAPEVQAMAPTLLRRYRSPFDNRPGSELPVVSGGFVITNSETGCGAFTIQPRLMVQICRNGLIVDTAAKVRRTHLGAALDADGIIPASEATMTKVLELITARTSDAMTAYLDTGFVQRMVDELEDVAATPVTDADTAITELAQKLRYTDEQKTAILSHFIAGADPTAGGIMHAVTSTAQTLRDADAAHDLESTAVRAMQLAATAA